MKKACNFTGLLMIASVLFLASCEQKDLGRYCVVGFDNSTGGIGVKAINAEAPECLDRICVLQTLSIGDASEIQSVQYCSQKCKNDSECSGADKSVDCAGGFDCIRLGAESTDLSGKCICECRDYLTKADKCVSRCSAGDLAGDDDCDINGK
jgi:hypothetical protein